MLKWLRDQKTFETYVCWLDRHKLLILALAALTTALGVFGMQRVKFDPDVLVYFDRQMPERKALEAIEDRFGRTNEAVFVLRSRRGAILDEDGLKAIAHLHRAAASLPNAISVRSILTLGEELDVGPSLLRENRPATAEEVRQIAAKAGFASRAVLAEDETVAAVAVVVPRNSRKDIDILAVADAAKRVQADAAKQFPGVEILLTGRLMMDRAFLVDGQDDTYFYAGLQVIALALVLLVTFRSFHATLMLNAMVLAATVISIGAVGWAGIALNGISSASPSVLVGLAVATGVHIIMAWQAALRRRLGRQKAVAAALAATAAPVALSVLTTLVSFLCLNFAASPPFRQLGNVVSCGLIAILLMSFTVLPALLLIVPKTVSKQSLALSEWMTGLSRFVIDRQRALLAAFMISLAAAIGGVAQITFDDTFSHYFDRRFEIRQATDLFEEKLSGTIFVDFSVPIAESERPFSPEHIARLQRFTEWLKARAEVASATSLASVAEDAAKSAPQLFDARGLPAAPAAEAALQSIYEQMRAKGLIGLVDASGKHSRVNVVLRGVSSAETLAFNAAALPQAKAIFGGEVISTGLPILSAQLSINSTRTMIWSMGAALVGISLILILALGSLRLGFISLMPNLIPVIAAFGLWGVIVGEVSFAATVVGALTFGIVVDDTVHILMKYRALRVDRDMEPEAAIEETFRSVGVPVVVTSVALAVSFFMFTFSGFLVNQHMGWLTAATIVAALIADLLFLPPLLLLAERHQRLGESLFGPGGPGNTRKGDAAAGGNRARAGAASARLRHP